MSSSFRITPLITFRQKLYEKLIHHNWININ